MFDCRFSIGTIAISNLQSAISNLIEGGSMRYLITLEYATTTPLAPPHQAHLLDQVVIPTLEACATLAQQQQILAGGVATSANRITLIVEAPTNEALTKVMHGLPGWSALQVT